MPVFERPYLQPPGHRKLPATRYSGVCSCESLSVSRHYLKFRNIGSPPGKGLDMALRKWAWPRTEKQNHENTKEGKKKKVERRTDQTDPGAMPVFERP
jgi:hypothetical protein